MKIDIESIQNVGLTLKTYQTIEFSEIAECISRRVQPDETTLDKYIGLEHLDPDSLAIVRWGYPNDVKGTKLIAKKGDIIFGKRRAYQRKVGVSPFDCICSAHAFVLREKLKKIERGFLAWFMLSETFTRRAIAISEGSLSPTIKWKTLGVQQFRIPRREDQKRIIILLQHTSNFSSGLAAQLEQTRFLQTAVVNCCGEYDRE